VRDEAAAIVAPSPASRALCVLFLTALATIWASPLSSRNHDEHHRKAGHAIVGLSPVEVALRRRTKPEGLADSIVSWANISGLPTSRPPAKHVRTSSGSTRWQRSVDGLQRSTANLPSSAPETTTRCRVAWRRAGVWRCPGAAGPPHQAFAASGFSPSTPRRALPDPWRDWERRGTPCRWGAAVPGGRHRRVDTSTSGCRPSNSEKVRPRAWPCNSNSPSAEETRWWSAPGRGKRRSRSASLGLLRGAPHREGRVPARLRKGRRGPNRRPRRWPRGWSRQLCEEGSSASAHHITRAWRVQKVRTRTSAACPSPILDCRVGEAIQVRCPFLALSSQQRAANGSKARHRSKVEKCPIRWAMTHDGATSSKWPQRTANVSFSAC